MKAAVLLLSALSTCAATLPPARPLEASFQSRGGFDSNPIGSNGTSAALLGKDDAFSYAAGVTMSLALAATSQSGAVPKLTYAGEFVRFDGRDGENFSTHRLALSGQAGAGTWKFSGDASSVFIAGSRDTLVSVSSGNANAISLWRERRKQWQHRMKLLAVKTSGSLVIRGGGTLLAYDYLTNVVPGKVAFADRSDVQASLDAGWKRSAGSLWLAGVRAGRQSQAIVPLPNCEFEYSNKYYRMVAAWEGKLFSNTTLTLAAGPDFRCYTGAVDTRVFNGGRNRTSLWYEGAFATKVSPSISLTGKAARMNWLSSTGKSAYTDSCVEAAANWMPAPAWSVRLTTKIHRCDYFPTVRDDWESFLGTGATFKMTDRATLSVDALSHRAWNHLDGVPERTFQRFVVSLGASFRL